MGAASSVSDELSGSGIVRGLLLRVCVTSVPAPVERARLTSIKGGAGGSLGTAHF